MQAAAEIIAYIFGVSLIRYFAIAGIAFISCYSIFSNRLLKFRIQHKKSRTKDFMRDIIHSCGTTFIFALIAFTILFTPLKQYTKVYDLIGEYPIWWIPACVVLSLIIHDTYFYWMHRLLHHPKLYTLSHRLHHRSTNPSPWTSYSFHLFEAITEGFILFFLVFLIPMHQISIIAFTIAAFVINVYGHLGYEIAPKWFRNSFLFNVLNTSLYHNMHHSQFKGNYGLYFRIWDRIMGTENPNYELEYDLLQKRRFENY